MQVLKDTFIAITATVVDHGLFDTVFPFSVLLSPSALPASLTLCIAFNPHINFLQDTNALIIAFNDMVIINFLSSYKQMLFSFSALTLAVHK